MFFTVFRDRFDPVYYKHLNDLLSDHRLLCEYATAPPKSKTYEDGKFAKGIQIDFCGIAASTLLGVTLEGEEDSLERRKISESFRRLLSVESTENLAKEGCYLKVRFIFSYVYSFFMKSLIEAETSLNRPRGKDRRILYSFDIQSKLSEIQIRNSSLYRAQESSLQKIAAIIEENPMLVMTRPEKSDHTLQVRFSTIAMPFCLMLVNNRSYSDSYLYAQEIGPRGLHNIFDYQWNNDVTLLCKDATFFDDQKGYQGLAMIRTPSELLFAQKEARIREALKKPVGEATANEWRANLVEKLSICLGESVAQGEAIRKSEPKTEPGRLTGGDPSLAVGKTEEGKFFFDLSVPAEDIYIRYEAPKDYLAFQLMLHVAVAAIEGKEPVMHHKHHDGKRIFKHISESMSRFAKNSTGEKIRIDTRFMLLHLFDANKQYQLRIPTIKIIPTDYRSWATDLKYVVNQRDNKENFLLNFED